MSEKESKESFALLFEQSEYYTLDEACDYLRTKHAVYNVTPEKLLKRLDTHQIPCFFYVSDVAVAGNVLKVKFVDDEKLYDISEPIKPPTMPSELDTLFYFAGKFHSKYKYRDWFYTGKRMPKPMPETQAKAEAEAGVKIKTEHKCQHLHTIRLIDNGKQYHFGTFPTFPKKTPRDKFQRNFLHTGNYTTIKNLKYATVVNYPIDLALNDVFIQHLGDRAFNGAYVGGKHICHHIAHYGYFDTWQMMTQIVGIDKVIDYNNDEKLYFVDDEIRQLLTKKYGVDDFSIVFDLAIAESWKYKEALPFLELKETDSETNKVVFRIYAKDLVIFHKDLLELEHRIINTTPAVRKEAIKNKTDNDKLFDIALLYCQKIANGELKYKNRRNFDDFIKANNHEKLDTSERILDSIWLRAWEYFTQARERAQEREQEQAKNNAKPT